VLSKLMKMSVGVAVLESHFFVIDQPMVCKNVYFSSCMHIMEVDSAASPLMGMRMQTFHANRIIQVVTRFIVQPVEVFVIFSRLVPQRLKYVTCMKCLCAHTHEWTQANQLASFTCG
jgi:hypothetical protein